MYPVFVLASIFLFFSSVTEQQQKIGPIKTFHTEKCYNNCHLDFTRILEDLILILSGNKNFDVYDQYFDEDFLEQLDSELVYIEHNFPHENSILITKTFIEKQGKTIVIDNQLMGYNERESKYIPLALGTAYKSVKQSLEATNHTINCLNFLQSQLNQYLPKGFRFISPVIDVQLLIYNRGGFLKRHNDTIADPYSAKLRRGFVQTRVLTLCLYLNKNYQEEHGGKLIIFDHKQNSEGEKERVIEHNPTWGKFVLIKSYGQEHASQRVFHKKRLLNMFLYVERYEDDMDEIIFE